MPVIQGVTELEQNENYQFCINERVYFYIKNKHLNLPQLTTAAMWLDANTSTVYIVKMGHESIFTNYKKKLKVLHLKTCIL